MRITSGSPEHLKRAAAKADPRGAAAAGIVIRGINDASVLAAADRADIRLPEAPAPVFSSTITTTAYEPPNRHSRREAAATWPQFAAYVRASLQVIRGPLAIWLPGLHLRSENAALKGEARGAKEHRPKHARGMVQVRNCASREARCAFQQADLGGIGRFETPVDIEVLQVSERRLIDPGNLFHKAVIDCLTARSSAGGLGIIADDSARYVCRVTVGYTDGPLVGVHVVIKESEVSR